MNPWEPPRSPPQPSRPPCPPLAKGQPHKMSPSGWASQGAAAGVLSKGTVCPSVRRPSSRTDTQSPGRPLPLPQTPASVPPRALSHPQGANTTCSHAPSHTRVCTHGSAHPTHSPPVGGGTARRRGEGRGAGRAPGGGTSPRSGDTASPQPPAQRPRPVASALGRLPAAGTVARSARAEHGGSPRLCSHSRSRPEHPWGSLCWERGFPAAVGTRGGTGIEHTRGLAPGALCRELEEHLSLHQPCGRGEPGGRCGPCPPSNTNKPNHRQADNPNRDPRQRPSPPRAPGRGRCREPIAPRRAGTCRGFRSEQDAATLASRGPGNALPSLGLIFYITQRLTDAFCRLVAEQRGHVAPEPSQFPSGSPQPRSQPAARHRLLLKPCSCTCARAPPPPKTPEPLGLPMLGGQARWRWTPSSPGTPTSIAAGPGRAGVMVFGYDLAALPRG